MSRKHGNREIVNKLKDMGFPQDKVIKAASQFTNLEDAVIYLLSLENHDQKTNVVQEKSMFDRDSHKSLSNLNQESADKLDETIKKPASQLLILNSKHHRKAERELTKEIRSRFRKVNDEIDQNHDVLHKKKKKLKKKIKLLSVESDEKTAKKIQKKLNMIKSQIEGLYVNKEKLSELYDKFSDHKTSDNKDGLIENINRSLDEIFQNIRIDEQDMERVESSFVSSLRIEESDFDIEEDDTKMIAIEQVQKIPINSSPKKNIIKNDFSQTSTIIEQKIFNLGLNKEYADILNMHQTFEDAYLGLITEIMKRKQSKNTNELDISRSRQIGTKTIILSSNKSLINPYQSIKRLDPFKSIPRFKNTIKELRMTIQNQKKYEESELRISAQGKKPLEEAEDLEEIEYDFEIPVYEDFEEMPDDIDEGDTSRNSPTNEGIIDILIEAFQAKGAPKELIKRIPIYTYEIDMELSYTTCIICLEEILLGDTLMLLRCDHFYHSSCLKKWLEGSKKCPLCNIDVC